MTNNLPKNISQEEINDLPLKAFEGSISVINDAERIPWVLAELKKHAVVGFDTETKPVFVRGQYNKVALMQLALPDKAFLIRLNLTGIPPSLGAFLEDYSIKKAGVAIRDDIKALQHLRKFQPQGFIELASVAKEKGLEVESVKKLTALLLGFRISKSAQTSNWEAPTLTEKQISYAATDAWACLEIYKKLQ
jgi:ribonuclease D